MERIKREELLARIHADRSRFEGAVSRVPRDRFAEPILPGGWSVKDVLAHIAWGEREPVAVLRAGDMSAASDLWNLSEDERNRTVVEASRGVGLVDVRAEYDGAFDDYVAALSQVSHEQLNDPASLKGLAELIPGWRPWRVFYDPTHYEEHRRTLEEALSRSASN